MLQSRYLSLLFAAFLAGGCGPSSGAGPQDHTGDGGLSTEDGDADGYSPAEGDCNDTNSGIHPGAADDTCDGVDQDCNSIIDDLFNADGDGYSTCMGDCDDGNAEVYPGAFEVIDGVDNDCDSVADNNRDDTDDDGDGYTELDGDCNDDEPLQNPGAVEVDEKPDGNGGFEAEGFDNDCDGMIDEGQELCDTGLAAATVDTLPRAMELCNWITSASLTADADERGRNIVGRFGDVYVPRAGESMAVLSTGIAVDASDPSFSSPNGGTGFGNSAAHPDPQPDPADGCGQADPTTVNDYTELTLEIAVPSNAKSMSFDFNFMSGEFPEYVCTSYDDTFLAILDSESYTGNISFDSQGRPVTINIGFFTVCPPGSGANANCAGDADLAGTGYGGTVGGGTGWLTTLAPVTPGETLTLRFIVFDEGDSAYDSLVLLDNVRWEAEPVDGPVTIDKQIADQWRAGMVDLSAWQKSAR